MFQHYKRLRWRMKWTTGVSRSSALATRIFKREPRSLLYHSQCPRLVTTRHNTRNTSSFVRIGEALPLLCWLMFQNCDENGNVIVWLLCSVGVGPTGAIPLHAEKHSLGDHRRHQTRELLQNLTLLKQLLGEAPFPKDTHTACLWRALFQSTRLTI